MSSTAKSGEWAIAREIEGSLNPQRKLLAELMHSDSLRDGDVGRALRQVTEIAARALRVERTSVWRFVHDGEPRLECVALFERTKGSHSAGTIVEQAQAPRYFRALAEERTLAAIDARTDERTAELATTYLARHGIGAMLDAPVFVRGRMVAVVCHEHVGDARAWHFWEELLAGTFSDFVALALESQGWASAERALRLERDALERTVDERTAELMTSEENLRVLFDITPVALVLTRLTTHGLVSCNRRAYSLFEIPEGAAIGVSLKEHWVHPTQLALFLQSVQSGRVDGLETELRTASGRGFWARISAQPLRYHGEDALLVSIDDINKQKRDEEQLRALATHDPLTGIHNRRSLSELGANELARARRYHRPFVAAMIDVDLFKQVNDTYGHAVGDEVLRSIVQTTTELLRGSDFFGRWGGEEFVALLPETDHKAAHRVLERVREAVEGRSVPINGHVIPVTISIGIAEWTGIESLETLVERADQACYAAKRAGRNRVELALPA